MSELGELAPSDYIESDPKILAVAADIESERVGRQKPKVKPRGKRRARK